MLTTPNFYRLEYNVAAIAAYNSVLTAPINFQGNTVNISHQPGLGVELDVDYLLGHLHPAWTM
jgi:galactonate dehydratase